MPPKATSSAPPGKNDEKLPLPLWLKAFTEKGVDMRVAMTLAAKLYPTNPSLSTISKLTGPKLEAAGITDKDHKRSILSAVRAIKTSLPSIAASSSSSGSKRGPPAEGDEDPTDQELARRQKKRRVESLQESYMDPEQVEELRRKRDTVESFDFKEVLDMELIRPQSCTTNRAPCMTAWAFVICEKMGFDRQEALSLASVFTSVTSTQHALSLGNIYTPAETREAQREMDELPKESKRKGANGDEVEEGYAQPWVGVMKRRLPVIQLTNGNYRAISKGTAVGPERGYAYITKNFKSCTPYVIGAMRLLAECFTVDELNEKGYGMYCHFRPEVDQWGDRATLYCGNILDIIPEEPPAPSTATIGDQAPENHVQPAGTEQAPEVVEQLKKEDDREVEMLALARQDDVGGTSDAVGGGGQDDVFEGIWEDDWEGE